MPSALTTTQAATIKAIVNLFETSQVLGDYGQVTVISGDTGHLTFGRSQTTLGSGNLHDLVRQYCDNIGARFRRRLADFLPRLKKKDIGLDTDPQLHNLLRATADDPVMRDVQDEFFDDRYFDPAMKAAGSIGISTPLGCAVAFDSLVHGSWDRIRDRVKGTPGTRDLTFVTTAPLLRGLDVRLVQLALSDRGADIRADGVFGRASSQRVADHQRTAGLPITGVADRALVLALATAV